MRTPGWRSPGTQTCGGPRCPLPWRCWYLHGRAPGRNRPAEREDSFGANGGVAESAPRVARAFGKLADLRTHDLPRSVRQATRDFEENQPAQLHHRRASGQHRARRASELQNGFHELRKGQLPRKMSQCFAPEKEKQVPGASMTNPSTSKIHGHDPFVLGEVSKLQAQKCKLTGPTRKMVRTSKGQSF